MVYKRGINLGGYFSQCEHTREHYEHFISEKDICRIAEWGFDHVRVPMDYEFLETEEGDDREENYILLERLLGWCRNAGLRVILDLHKTAGYDFNDAQEQGRNRLFEERSLQERFLALWQRLAQRFGDREDIAFELLNELVNPEYAAPWNQLAAEAVKVIRQETANTLIIYGGVEWNSAKSVPMLGRPLDENIMYTFHYYEPLLFTHQKANWVAAMKPDEEIPYPKEMEWYRKKSLALGLQGMPVANAKASGMGLEFHEEMLGEAIAYAKAMGVRLYCGEFGVIDLAPEADTRRWFQDVISLFDRLGIGYALWSYKEMNFDFAGAHYDSVRNLLISRDV